ncbi:DHHC palmitoyltransferase-domain-containing protein [Zopfochytrium polystomum]|nr:DHHC palmitoyltransferase-domain-containing protein [Zopfochytrium polystomum]
MPPYAPSPRKVPTTPDDENSSVDVEQEQDEQVASSIYSAQTLVVGAPDAVPLAIGAVRSVPHGTCSRGKRPVEHAEPVSAPTTQIRYASMGMEAKTGDGEGTAPFCTFRGDETVNQSLDHSEPKDLSPPHRQPQSHQEPGRPKDVEHFASRASRKLRNRQAKALKIPVFIFSYEQFFSSASFDPRQFNMWWKRDGFQRPIHAYTIGYLVVVVFLAVGFFGFLQFFVLSFHLRVAIFALAGFLCLGHIAFAVITMTIDPEDASVRNAKVPRNPTFVKRRGVPVIDPRTGLCGICQVHVDARTRHCKPCNKCVARFDHHCPYLSTCIGKANYSFFIATISTGFILCTFVTAIAVRASVLYITERNTFEGAVNGLLGFGETKIRIALASTVLYAIVGLVVDFLVAGLLGFHLRIIALRLTTIEFVEARDALQFGAPEQILTPTAHAVTRIIDQGRDFSSQTPTLSTEQANHSPQQIEFPSAALRNLGRSRSVSRRPL